MGMSWTSEVTSASSVESSWTHAEGIARKGTDRVAVSSGLADEEENSMCSNRVPIAECVCNIHRVRRKDNARQTSRPGREEV